MPQIIRIKVTEPGTVIITGIKDGRLEYYFEPVTKAKAKTKDPPDGSPGVIDDIKSLITGAGKGRFADVEDTDDNDE